jgi:hypothetical protein
LVNDLRQVGGFLRVLRFPPPIKTDRHDIPEILLKVALNIIYQTKPEMSVMNNHILISRLMDLTYEIYIKSSHVQLENF